MKKLLIGCLFFFLFNLAFALNKNTTPTIKIGFIAELTGNLKDIGKTSKNAALLAVKTINDAGGIKIGATNYRIELIMANTNSDPKQAVKVAQNLITQHKVLAIIGPNSTSNTLPVAEAAEQAKILMITPWATDKNITQDQKTKLYRQYVFRACFNDEQEAREVGKFAKYTLKAKTAATLFDSDFIVFKDQAKLFQKTFTQLGGTIVASESYNHHTKSFDQLLVKLKNASPDVIFMPSYSPGVAPILTAARKNGITAPFIGSDGWLSGNLFQYCGLPCNGSYVLTHYSTTINNPANQRFISAYQNQYKTLPNDIAALTYDAFGLLELALKNAPTPTRDEVYLGMIKITHFQGITGKIIFHKEITDPVKNGFIMKIQEGKLTDSFEFIHAL